MHTLQCAKRCLKSGCGRGVASGPGKLATMLINDHGTCTHHYEFLYIHIHV